MRKKVFLGVASGLAVLLVAGGLFASNMGFKLNTPLLGPGAGSASGNRMLALPFNQQTNLVDAKDLIDDINATAGASVVNQVAQYASSADSFASYNGLSGVAFPLVAGAGYLVQVTTTVNYIVVGSHDPGKVLTLFGPGPNAASGTNTYGYPYHSIASDAKDLIDEVNAAAGSTVVNQIAQYVASGDSIASYNGLSGTAFNLNPGEAYFIQVTSDTSFVPAHY